MMGNQPLPSHQLTWKCKNLLSRRKAGFLPGSVHLHVCRWEGRMVFPASSQLLNSGSELWGCQFEGLELDTRGRSGLRVCLNAPKVSPVYLNPQNPPLKTRVIAPSFYGLLLKIQVLTLSQICNPTASSLWSPLVGHQDDSTRLLVLCRPP